MATVSTVTAGSSAISQLVNQLMVLERQPINRLKTQKDQLDVRRGVYVDTQSKLSALKLLAEDLSAAGTVFGLKTATVSDATVLSATAGPSAANLAYTVSNVTLAKSHLVTSNTQGDPATPLGQSGTLLLGGAASRSVANAVVVDTTVTGLGTGGSVRAGQRELSDGTYYVEIRDNAGVKEFRVVDSQGQAVSIDDAKDSGTAMTTGWQTLSLVSNTTFDTTRGLTITFGSGTTVGTKGNGAAHVDYTAQGAQITVSAGQSLNDIQGAINSATYAKDQAVSASVIQTTSGVYKLTLQAEVSGTVHSLQAQDLAGTVLQNLGVLNTATPNDFKNVAQSATNASFTINGLTVTRTRNTGLTDVIGGVTINLLKDTISTLTLSVAPDSSSIKAKAQEFLTQFNEVLSYLKAKMATDTTTYTRGPLAGDGMFVALRYDLMTDLTGLVTGLESGVPTSLAAIGITVDATTLQVQISDSEALDAALGQDPAGIGELFSAVMARVTSTLDPLVSISGITQLSINAIDDQKEVLDDRIQNLEELLPRKEAQLRGQFGAMQAQINQLAMIQAGFSSSTSFGSYNQLA